MATPGEPSVPSVTRGQLPSGAAGRIAARTVLWAAGQAAVTALLAQLGWLDRAPTWSLGLGLGVGLAAAHPRKASRALTAGLAAAALVGLFGLSGMDGAAPLLLGGAAVGLGAAWLCRPLDGVRGLQGALAGASGAGLGAWVASALPTAGLAPALSAGIDGACIGLGAAQALWVASLVWIRSDRPPSETRIRTTLAEAYRPPCLRALALDRAVAPQAPDAETRDGLAEVAAWVYRLSWTLQTLDRELRALDPDQLDARISAARATAEESLDEATRAPRAATARHLEQLGRHRDALAVERERTSALVDYALAFLEQARAGLALASVRPSEGAPERLGDVLTQLRSRATEGDALRTTARQLTPLA